MEHYELDTMRRATRRYRSNGFTLLELMIVASILAFGLLTLSAMQLQALRGGSRGRHSSTAAAIAEAQMEQLEVMSWTAPLLAPTGGWTALPDVDNTVQGDPSNNVEETYRASYQIADDVANWTRTIDVRVAWDDEDTPNRSVTLSSIRYNRENL
jgi:prepilin-type N-terminal cleavage/methylation domain-containing protein